MGLNKPTAEEFYLKHLAYKEAEINWDDHSPLTHNGVAHFANLHAQNKMKRYKASLRKEIEKMMEFEIFESYEYALLDEVLSLLDTIKDDQDEKLTGTIKADGNFTVTNTDQDEPFFNNDNT